LTGRSDMLLFWRSGQFRSVDNAAWFSNLGFVFYGHAMFPPGSNATNYGDNATDGSTINRWIFSRFNRLYIPDNLTVGGDILSRVIPGPRVESNIFGSDMKDLSWAYQTNANTFTSNMSPWISAIPRIDNITTDHYRILANTCGEVRIRFLLPTEDANHTDIIEDNSTYSESDNCTLWPPDNDNASLEQNVWLDLPNPGTTGLSCAPGNMLNPLTLNGTPLGVVCFTPGNNLWPKALEFTIRLYDQNLTVKSEDAQQTGTNRIHGGMTYTFVVPLSE
jgi:hypothetical protein